jgi:dCTP diphosphatase
MRWEMSDLAATVARIRAFRDARDWMQFHNPKNLASSIVIEAAELLELFQWKTPEESNALVQTKRTEIEHELADIAVYVLELADNLGIDLLQAIDRKMALNEAKYPVEKARGSAAKYTEL